MADGVAAVLLQPAVALSILVGAFNTSAFLVIFGRIGWHTLATLVCATIGAWVADALLGPGGIMRLGDYSLLLASLGAWVAIGGVELAAWLRGRGREDIAVASSGVDAP